MTVNQYGQNAWQPYARQDTFIPDQLIAGNLQLVTKTVVIGAGQVYKRGTVLGRASLKSAIASAATGTGNGTIGKLSVGSAAETGVYTLKATAADKFALTDPTGDAAGIVTVGQPFTGNQLNLTITAGATAFVAGDAFTVTVSPASNEYTLSVRTAVDGTQNPTAILVDDVDTSAGALSAGVYLMGGFNQNRVTFDDSWTIEDLADALRDKSIFLQDSITGPGV